MVSVKAPVVKFCMIYGRLKYAAVELPRLIVALEVSAPVTTMTPPPH